MKGRRMILKSPAGNSLTVVVASTPLMRRDTIRMRLREVSRGFKRATSADLLLTQIHKDTIQDIYPLLGYWNELYS
jgi:hypothetical protein